MIRRASSSWCRKSQPMNNNPLPPQTEDNSLPEASGAVPGMKTPGRVSIIRVLGTVLSLALLVYLISVQGWEEILRLLGSLPPYSIWIALGLMLLSRFSVGLRWYALLHSAGVKMSLWQSLRLTFMGLFASNFLPTTIGGDVVRLAGSIGYRVDSGVSAASLVVDRLVGMVGMASLAPFGLAMVLRPVERFYNEAPQLAFLPALSRTLSRAVSRVSARLPFVGKIYQKGQTFARSLLRSSVYWLRHPRGLLLALLCTYAHMLFSFVLIWLLLRGMHQSLSLWKIGALWSLNYFITTFLPISINGLGLQEVTIPYLYATFGGVSMEAGLALTVLMRLLPTFASLPGAIFLPDILRMLPARRQKTQPDPRQELS